MVIEDLYKHERKLIMSGIGGINEMNRYRYGFPEENSEIPPKDTRDWVENSTFGTGFADGSEEVMGMTVQSSAGNNPVVEDVETDEEKQVKVQTDEKPVKKEAGKEISFDELIQARINEEFYGELKETVENALENQDSYNYTLKLGSKNNPFGFKEIDIVFKKDNAGNITADYKMPYTLEIKAPKGDAVVFNKEEQEKYNKLCRELTNPNTKEDRKTQIREEIKKLYEPYAVVNKGGKYYIDYSRIDATISATERLAKFHDREVVYKDKNFNIHDIRHAQQRLQDEKDGKYQYENEETRNADLALSKQFPLSLDSQRFVDRHKYLFFENGEFSSKLFKEFALGLTGNDGYLSLQDRHEPANKFLMRGTEAAHKAQIKLNENNGDYSKLTPEEKELVTLENEEKWNEAYNKAFIVSPLGKAQAAIVRDAGLEADDNIEPLLTATSIAFSLGISLSSIRLEQSQKAQLLFNGTEIPNNTTIPPELIVEGQNHLQVIGVQNQMQSQYLTAMPILHNMNGNNGQAASIAYNTPMDGEITGSFTLTCPDCCPEEKAQPKVEPEVNTVVVHDEKNNEILIDACSDEEQIGCPTIRKRNIVSVPNEYEIVAYLNKYGKTKEEGATYRKGLQTWQLEKAFGVGQIQDKERQKAVRKAIREQLLGGNDAIPAGIDIDYKTCLKIVVNGVEEDYPMVDEKYWKNATPVIYKLGSNKNYVQGKPIPKVVNVRNGHAWVKITVNGEEKGSYEVNVDGGRDDAIAKILKQVPEEYQKAVMNALDNCNCYNK